MKKWIAAILTLVLLSQALPWTAFAAGNVGDMITDDELQRAFRLAGLQVASTTDNRRMLRAASVGPIDITATESGYHDGMEPEDTWNAQLLVDWLEDELFREIYNATNVFTRANTLLEKIETDDPELYARIMDSTPSSGDYVDRCLEWMLHTEGVEEEARFYANRVKECIVTIETNAETLANNADALFDYEQASLSEQIREATAELDTLRSDILEFFRVQLAMIDLAQETIDGVKDPDFSEWLKDVLALEDGPTMSTVPSSTIRKAAASTRMSRLAANESVLPKATSQDTHILVLNENDFGIVIKGTDNKPLVGVTVTVKDLKGKAVKTVKTEDPKTGVAKFNANDFVSNYDKEMELSLEVDASAVGYRSFFIPWLIIKRGGHRDEHLVPLSGTDGSQTGGVKGYIRTATFNGYDILRQDKSTIISKINDATVNFEAVVEHAAGVSLKAPVLHYWKNEQSGADIVPKEQTMEPTSSEKVSDTQTKYIWKGTWKRDLSPDIKKDQKPYFVLPDTGEVFKTLLTPVPSYVDEPTSAGTGSPLREVVKKFGFSVTLPVIGGTLGLDLPLDKYLPKVAVNPAGYVTVSMGTSLTDPKWPTEWKNAEKEQYDRAMKDYQHTYKLANKMAQVGNAKSYYKSGKGQGSAKFDFGAFQMMSGKWQKSGEDKAIFWSADGVFGFTFTFNADYTKPFTIGPIPFYLNINFSATAGFAFEGLSVTFMTTEKHEFKNFKFDYLRGITIEVRLALTVTFGIGIKGLFSAWVAATGAINVILQLRKSDPYRVAIYLDATVSAGFEIFWIKYSKGLIKTPKVKVYANYDVDRDPMKAINLFMAYAEESSGGEKKVELVPEEPDKYSALAPTATPVIKGEENSRADIKVITYGSYTYVFYLGTVKGKDGKDHRRLCWLELKTRKTGNMQSNLTDKVAGLDDYDFDVFRTNGEVSLDLIYVMVLCGRNFDEKTGLPKVSYDDNENNVNTYYYVTRLDPDASYETPGTLYVRGIVDAPWLTKEKDKRYPLIANPRIDSVNIWSGGNDYLYGTLDGFGEDGKKLGYNVFSVSAANRKYDVFSKDTSVKGPWKDNQSYQRIAIRSNYKSSDSIGNGGNYKNPILAWVGLSGPTGDGKGDNYLELFDFDMNSARTPKSCKLDDGDIGAFEVIQTLNPDSHKVATQTVYYTKAQTAGTIKEYRLKSVTLSNKTGKQEDYKLDANYVDYDLTIPVTDFHTANIKGNQYIYWISAETKEKDSDPNVWRITGVYLEPNSKTMSDQLVLAEFTLEDTEWRGKKYRSVPYQVRLTNTETGYITAKPDTGDEQDRDIAPCTLYSFPMKLKPVLNLQKAALMETTVVQGEFITTDFSLMNAGNMGVSGFDIEVWRLENGVEKQKVELLHADCLEPEKSTLTLFDDKGGSSVVAQGEKAFYRYKEFNYAARQREWMVKREDKTISVKDGDQFNTTSVNDKTNKLATNVLVPGALGSFNSSIKIPADWSGQYDLRLKLTNVSTYTNWLGATPKPANPSTKTSAQPRLFTEGEQATPAGVSGQKLVYQLDEASGRLVLQNRSEAQDGDDDWLSLYAEFLEAPEPIDINCNVHDIDIDHRLYYDSYGEEILDFIISNYYNNDEHIDLTCAVYVNESESPFYINLPYDPESVSAGKTTTISVPLSLLVDTATTESARFVVSARRIDETALANNEFTIYPGGTSMMLILEQPASTTARPGESAAFTVDVTGGEGAYAYQWQVFVDGKWQNIPGATNEKLTLEKVKPEWNGRKTRCIIADGGREINVDANGEPVIPAGDERHYVVSGEAVLIVLGDAVDIGGGEDGHPDTGDHANLPLYLVIALIALALLALTRRRKPH